MALRNPPRGSGGPGTAVWAIAGHRHASLNEPHGELAPVVTALAMVAQERYKRRIALAIVRAVLGAARMPRHLDQDRPRVRS